MSTQAAQDTILYKNPEIKSEQLDLFNDLTKLAESLVNKAKEIESIADKRLLAEGFSEKAHHKAHYDYGLAAGYRCASIELRQFIWSNPQLIIL